MEDFDLQAVNHTRQTNKRQRFGAAFILHIKRPSPQSSGSTFTIAAPWLLPIHSTGRPLVSSTNTRRILVVRGMRYSVTSSVLVLIRETRSFDIDPVHTSVPPLVGTAS